MRFFFDRTMTLRRLRRIDENRSVYSATGTAVGYSISFQNPSPDRVEHYDGNIADMREIYVDDSCPIDRGDQAVINGVIYSVQDMKHVDPGWGIVNFKRVIVTRGDIK